MAGPPRPLRVVIDANTFIAAVISRRNPGSTTARAVDLALSGASRVIVCPQLLDEVEDVLGREKLRRWVQETEIPDVMAWILSGSVLGPNPTC